MLGDVSIVQLLLGCSLFNLWESGYEEEALFVVASHLAKYGYIRLYKIRWCNTAYLIDSTILDSPALCSLNAWPRQFASGQRKPECQS